MGRQEIEIKLAVRNPTAMQRLLRRAGARRLRRVFESNTLFDTPRGTLRKRGRLLRLRIETPTRAMGEHAGGAHTGAPLLLRVERPARALGHRQSILTLKGPSQSGGRYKVRSEIEIGVAPPKAVVDLLAAAGLRPTFRYEKFRSSYRVASFPRLHVELDETPMGTYLELEGPPRAIDQMARKLGFAAKEYITQSYLALYLDECRRKRVPAGDFVFARRKK